MTDTSVFDTTKHCEAIVYESFAIDDEFHLRGCGEAAWALRMTVSCV